MRSTGRLMLLFLVGALAISGCSTLRSLLASESGAAGSSAPAVAAAPSVPRFTFFDSWASW